MIEFIQKHIVLILCGWGFVFAWMFWANGRPYKPPKKFLEQQREAAIRRDAKHRNRSSSSGNRNPQSP